MCGREVPCCWYQFEFQAKKAKQAEIERKRAEVRKRMEEASKAKKAKKGFMTPERKKKLRVSYDNRSLDLKNLTFV